MNYNDCLNSDFDGIIFDIDGTLTSTNELIFASFNHVTKKYLNRSYSNEEIIELFGPTEDVILRNWMKTEYNAARIDYYKFYESNHEAMTKSIPGINELLQDIKKSGIPLSIYTGKGRESSLITLNKIGAYDYFDLIVTGDDVDDHKPSPEGILKFIKKFNLPPQNVLMIGDAAADIIAAKDAGCKSASVLWDCYDLEKVKSLNGDYYVSHVDELREVIFKLNECP